jgi:farnesyl diphosphate synthase
VPGLVPTFTAITLTAFVVLISNALSNQKQKIVLQMAFFGTAFSVAVAMLIGYAGSGNGSLQAAWTAFSNLPTEIRFALSVVAIGLAYFGGGLYIAAPDQSIPRSSSSAVDAFKTPASIDNDTSFDVPAVLPEKDYDLFLGFLDRLRKEIVNDLPTVYEMPGPAVNWVDRMIDYTVAGGKMNRGLALVDVQKTLAKAYGRPVTNKDRCQAAALGWCVEFLQAFFLVADDVMDNSSTRRGNPCWFRLHEVQLISINDSFILESCVYKILKKYFGKEKYYYQLVDLFIEVTRQTELGQLLDLTSQPLGGPIDLDRFTMDRYTSIVRYKTAFYSFYLPVALGMIMSGITEKKHFEKAREILLIMGEYFQIQDDYLDCYGAPEVIGKIGTDIQDNKCSWLVVKALGKVNAAQRRILEENYGRHEDSCVQTVKRLYLDLKLKEEFEAYEEESYASIQRLLSEVTSMPKDVFEFLLKKIYKRSK